MNKLTEDRAELSFSLEQYEIDSKETQTFHFAVSTRDDILCRGTIHSSANTSPRQLSIGERGWYGADYVQWFSFSLGSPNIPPAPEGTIIVETDKPVFSPTQAQAPITDVNGILYLPLRRPLRKKHAAEKQTSPFKTGLRMSIVQEGIYHISGRQLQQTGVPLSAVSPASLRLFNRGKELPLYVESHSDNNFDTDDYVSFYAKPLRDKHRHLDQYARAEAYWLVWELPGVALRVAELSGARRRQDLIVIDSTGGSRRLKAREFADTLHFEKDTDIRWLSSIYEVEQMSQSPHASDSVDNWYWGFIGDKELTEYSIDVPGPSRNQNHFARLRISLMGLSSNNSVADDHLLEVLLNDDQLGAAPQIATWDGQNPYIFESEPFPTAQLKEGTNRVIFRRPDRSFVDRSALNWIELEYMRDFKALDNTLFFRSSPRDTNDLFQFSLSGFDSPDVSVWDISHNRFFTQLESTKQHNLNSYTIAFQDSIIRPTRYIAVADHKRLLPESMTIDTISRNWHFPDVNYVMLTVDSLVPTLKPLADLHEKKGLRCEIVTIQDVYNSFSHGIQDPAGIQKMLQHVVSSQPTPSLKYLLLAGDATHDHYKQRQHLTLVPTHLSRVPGWGPAADDGFFATIIGNDNFPDLAVGRFPARDRHDLQIMVDKTINYILYPNHGYWRDNLLLAGGYEPDFTAFNDMAQSAILADRFNIIRMDADPQSPYYHNQNIAATTMSGHINAGVHFLNFAGHGGGNIWSDSRFFSYEDLPGLHNSQWGTSGRLPVIFSFTCLTGFFESVFYKSLGEEFVRNSADGAIAFYGASAYTRKEIDLQFNRIVLENLVHGSFKTLGDLIQHSELLA
ncbi:MAG: C25 family cysteine peptidase, partial [Chitinivibrionales bacterium]